MIYPPYLDFNKAVEYYCIGKLILCLLKVSSDFSYNRVIFRPDERHNINKQFNPFLEK